MNRIKQTTEYNGINLLSSSGESVASSGQFIEEITRRDTSGMTTLASVDESISLTSGTHSISTADELSKLAAMTNNGLKGIGYGAPMSGTAQLVTMDGLHKLISQGILPDYKSKTGINSSS